MDKNTLISPLDLYNTPSGHDFRGSQFIKVYTSAFGYSPRRIRDVVDSLPVARISYGKDGLPTKSEFLAAFMTTEIAIPMLDWVAHDLTSLWEGNKFFYENADTSLLEDIKGPRPDGFNVYDHLRFFMMRGRRIYEIGFGNAGSYEFQLMCANQCRCLVFFGTLDETVVRPSTITVF